jgi:NADH-quinone oxidoreductase subunit L
MGLVAAFLTAFYMMRLFAMTFLGQTRIGEGERAHLREAPWVMTGPLVVLGVLSVIGGVINLPAFVGGHEWLEHWLEPVVASAIARVPVTFPHGTTEVLLIAGAILTGVAGLMLGWRWTLSKPIPVARDAPPETGFAKVLFRKYYVDEIYNALLVRPLVGISRWVLWRGMDQGLIDGAGAKGSAMLARALGWLGSRLQSGSVGVYVLIFLIGAVWLLRAVAR